MAQRTGTSPVAITSVKLTVLLAAASVSQVPVPTSTPPGRLLPVKSGSSSGHWFCVVEVTHFSKDVVLVVWWVLCS